jgi:hypothetical protein
MTPSNTTSRIGRILLNHLGFHNRANKQLIIVGPGEVEFEIQNMALNRPATMGGPEDFEAVLTGTTREIESSLGDYSVADFSELTTPGIYRVVLPETGEHSYHFAITSGAFALVPEMALRFVHAWRSGPFENAWRGPSHLDDGVRSDSGEAMDAVGGWYDAGDVRKWMVHSNLPALAFMDAHQQIPWQYSEWEQCEEGWTPWLHEACWGLDFILKMQDPDTGMFYEDVGGGRTGRKEPGMLWFYENHSGCYADNADNRFTDNETGTGDERPVRIQYNPVVQFTSTCILARAARTFRDLDATRSKRCLSAAQAGWYLGLEPDPRFLETPEPGYEGWTSVRSWRCLAALELFRCGSLPWEEVEQTASALLDNYDASLGFWMNENVGSEPYRALLHSAQPLIALAQVVRERGDSELGDRIRSIFTECLERYVFPLSSQSPFGFIPFGVYTKAASEKDVYRPWRDGYLFRFFMPEHHSQKINHGLAGHWTSWAHGLALLAGVLNDSRARDLAWQQLYWLTGQNLHNSCQISGLGYNNPMPHSRHLGTQPGGFFIGFIGTADDRPHVDLQGDAQWNTTEYWMTGLSNAVMALSLLQPRDATADDKLGKTS